MMMKKHKKGERMTASNGFPEIKSPSEFDQVARIEKRLDELRRRVGEIEKAISETMATLQAGRNPRQNENDLLDLDEPLRGIHENGPLQVALDERWAKLAGEKALTKKAIDRMERQHQQAIQQISNQALESCRTYHANLVAKMVELAAQMHQLATSERQLFDEIETLGYRPGQVSPGGACRPDMANESGIAEWCRFLDYHKLLPAKHQSLKFLDMVKAS